MTVFTSIGNKLVPGERALAAPSAHAGSAPLQQQPLSRCWGSVFPFLERKLSFGPRSSSPIQGCCPRCGVFSSSSSYLSQTSESDLNLKMQTDVKQGKPPLRLSLTELEKIVPSHFAGICLALWILQDGEPLPRPTLSTPHAEPCPLQGVPHHQAV